VAGDIGDAHIVSIRPVRRLFGDDVRQSGGN